MRIISVLQGPSNYLPEQLQFCPGQELTIVPSRTFAKYEWSNGAISSSIRVKDRNTYILKVVDVNGCTGIDTVNVLFKTDCPQSIHFPNAFTPNGDQYNDRFAPKVYGIVAEYQFEIYNRWGQRIFHSTTPNEGWDGRIKGILQSSEVFAWKCSWQFPGQEVQNRSGVVTLVR